MVQYPIKKMTPHDDEINSFVLKRGKIISSQGKEVRARKKEENGIAYK